MTTHNAPFQPSLLVEMDDAPAITEKLDHIGPASVNYIQPKQILTRTSGFMDAYDFTLNPYIGCSFGCSYCYAAFFSYDDVKTQTWGKWVEVKENAVELLRKRRRGFLNDKRIYMSSVTDAYQPIESKLEVTRDLLSILAQNHSPKLVVQTRSPSVTRDIDLFKKIQNNGGKVQVNMTITTDDDLIRKTFEPSCPSNAQRLKAISAVQTEGIRTCITLTPLLLVTDKEQLISDLVGSGVRQFIIQPFHFRKGRFVAGTRDKALDLLTEKLQCTRKQLIPQYQELYQDFRNQMKTELDRLGLPKLGEGKTGFAPPF